MTGHNFAYSIRSAWWPPGSWSRGAGAASSAPSTCLLLLTARRTSSPPASRSYWEHMTSPTLTRTDAQSSPSVIIRDLIPQRKYLMSLYWQWNLQSLSPQWLHQYVYPPQRSPLFLSTLPTPVRRRPPQDGETPRRMVRQPSDCRKSMWQLYQTKLAEVSGGARLRGKNYIKISLTWPFITKTWILQLGLFSLLTFAFACAVSNII